MLAPTSAFLSTVIPIFTCKAIPVLVNADSETGLLDPADLERHIIPHTKAIVVAHLFGFPVPMRPVKANAQRYGLKIVEECTQAMGVQCHGQKPGAFGNVAIVSFQEKKMVLASEEGMLLPNDPEI